MRLRNDKVMAKVLKPISEAETVHNNRPWTDINNLEIAVVEYTG